MLKTKLKKLDPKFEKEKHFMISGKFDYLTIWQIWQNLRKVDGSELMSEQVNKELLTSHKFNYEDVPSCARREEPKADSPCSRIEAERERRRCQSGNVSVIFLSGPTGQNKKKNQRCYFLSRKNVESASKKKEKSWGTNPREQRRRRLKEREGKHRGALARSHVYTLHIIFPYRRHCERWGWGRGGVKSPRFWWAVSTRYFLNASLNPR